jgi:uncharacterized protein
MAKKGHLSRRDFLKAAGTVSAASLIGATRVAAQTSGQSEPEAPEHPRVPTRPFGKTGVQVPVLSLGGMFDIPSNQMMLKQALHWGVTYWDTADCYGNGKSETGIGEFFKKYPDTRGQVFLVTKSDSHSPEGMTRLLYQSLERMNTHFIDLYFIHGISSIKEMKPDMKTWAEKAKAEGKIKLFGFSTHSNMEDCLQGAAKLGWIDGIMMTYNFRIMHQEQMKNAVEACTRAGIGLTAMKTQGGGPLTVDSESELEMASQFLTQGFTDKQAKLKAVWDNSRIASICSQMPNLTILSANVAAALNQTKLSAAAMRQLEAYARETASGYCAGCARICEAAIGESLPIADLMRCLMYYRSYGDHDRARSLFAELPPTTREHLMDCDFSPAERNCPQHLRIGKLIEEATVLLA